MHRMLRVAAVALTVSASSWSSMHAQTIEFRNGQQPTELLRGTDKQPRLFFVAADGYRPKVRWDESAAPAGPALPFLDPAPYYAIDYFQGDKGPFYLLTRLDALQVRAAAKPLGWIRADLLATNEARIQQGTKIYYKAMIVNRVDDFKDGNVETEKVSPTLAPRKGARENNEGYALFNVFFEYGRTYPDQYGLQEEPYVLIGNTATFDPLAIAGGIGGGDAPEGVRSVIQGWVPQRRIATWLTREGFCWDAASTYPTASPRRPQPGKVFRKPEDAWSALTGDLPEGRGAFDESFDIDQRISAAEKVSIAFKPDNMRYPNLPWSADEENVNKRTTTGNELLKVGGIGGLGGMSARDVDDIKRQIARVQQMTTRTEILFVIDDTASMRKYFADVAEVVQRIAAESRRSQREIYVAVAFYNDIDGKSQNWNPVTVGPLVALNGGSADDAYAGDIVEYIKSRTPNSGGDKPEMLFWSIAEAVSSVKFSLFARKLVIVISDVGDAGRSRSGPVLTEEKVAQALFGTQLDQLSRAPIELLALQVGNPKEDEYTRAFTTQMEQIVELLNTWGNQNPEIKRTLGFFDLAGSTEVITKLNARYDELQKEIDKREVDMTKLRSGQFHTDVGPELTAILKTFQVDLKQLREKGGVQLFDEGYVWAYAPGLEAQSVRQVRSQLMFNQKDLEDIIALLGKLVSQNAGLFTKKLTVEEAIANVLSESVGEDFDRTKSFEEHLLKQHGIKTKSPLLQKPLNSTFPARLGVQEMERIKYRLDLLKDIRTGVKREWIEKKRPFGEAEISYFVGSQQTTPDNRAFELPGASTKWYWIDIETEMP